MKEILSNKEMVISHYDALIDENNDSLYDPKPLRDYMDQWDGSGFMVNIFEREYKLRAKKEQKSP